MIDTHCHLSSDEFNSDLSEVIERAKQIGVNKIISLGVNLEQSKKALKISREYYGYIFPTIGIHPEDIDLGNDEFENNSYLIDFMRELKSNLKEYMAIGEIGMDYFFLNRAEYSTEDTFKHKKLQKKVFEQMLRIAAEDNKPVVIHARSIVGEHSCTLDCLSMLQQSKVRKAVFHCFVESKEIAEKILKLGYFISFTNIITYPKNTELAETAKFVCKNFPTQVMFETDAPYLPPANKRGKRCEPSYVKNVYDFLKEEISEEVVDRNAERFFEI